MTIFRFISLKINTEAPRRGKKLEVDSFPAGCEFTLIGGEKHDAFVIKVISRRADILENNSVIPLR